MTYETDIRSAIKRLKDGASDLIIAALAETGPEDSQQTVEKRLSFLIEQHKKSLGALKAVLKAIEEGKL